MTSFANRDEIINVGSAFRAFCPGFYVVSMKLVAFLATPYAPVAVSFKNRFGDFLPFARRVNLLSIWSDPTFPIWAILAGSAKHPVFFTP